MSEFDVAPGPLSAFRKIPANVRWWIYALIGTVFAIEGILDVAGVGLIPDGPQAIAWSIAGLFGAAQAVANTEKA